MTPILHPAVELPLSPDQAFAFFADAARLQRWLAPAAEVEPALGGKYELFWDPADRENDSTIGCTITAFEPGKLIAFEWKGARQFKHFMNEADPLTHVTVSFFPTARGTEVHLLHTGWRRSPEWDEARKWFAQAWAMAFDALEEAARV